MRKLDARRGLYLYWKRYYFNKNYSSPTSYLTKTNRILLVAVTGCILFYLHSFAQVTDSSSRPGRPRTDSISRLDRLERNNIFQFFRNSITRGPVDSANMAVNLHTKSESVFKPFEGRVIRHIYIESYGFDQVFTDTSKRLEYFGTKVLNDMHRTTRDWVIRNSLAH